MERIQNLGNFYIKEILPIITKFQNEQKNARKNFLICAAAILLLILLLVFTIILLFLTDSDKIRTILCYGLIAICLIDYVAISYLYQKLKCIKQDFEKKLKRKTLPSILKYFEGMNFDVDRYGAKVITTPEIERSSIFKAYKYNIIEGDDQLEGTYKDINYAILEANLIHENSKGERYSTYKGVVIAIEHNKKIKGKTVITQKKEKYKSYANTISLFLFSAALCVLIGYCTWLKIETALISPVFGFFIIFVDIVMSISIFLLLLNFQNRENKIKDVTLEDIDFQKKYKVYSEDQVEARYLITPSFIERFKNLKTAFKADEIKCSFFDDKIMFAIKTNKNLFEIGDLFKPLNNYQTFKEFYDELNSIYEMIDHFKLDEKTGL